jgi:hypothetical protein
MRGGLNLTLLAVTALGASVIAAALNPSRAYSASYDHPSGTVIANNIILLMQLPPDDYSQLRSSFGSYMYQGLLPRPYNRATLNGAPIPLTAPISARAYAPRGQ